MPKPMSEKGIEFHLKILSISIIKLYQFSISNILFALRTEKVADGKSAFEGQTGRKPNTLKSVMVEKCVLDKDPLIEIDPEDFSETDSTILVRERMRGTKLEGAFKKVKGAVEGQSGHTITILPKTGKERTYSKRDVAWLRRETPNEDEPQCSSGTKPNKENGNVPKAKKVAKRTKTKISQQKQEMGKVPKWSDVAPYINPEESDDQDTQQEDCSDNQEDVNMHKTEMVSQPEETNEQQKKDEEREVTSASHGESGVSIKWEKKRTSSRVTKKPDRLGNKCV